MTPYAFARKAKTLIYIFLIARTATAGELPVKYLGIEQGLSNNAVISICQDHNGFLWIGTYDGLNRYDGYGFKVFHNVIGDSTSLAINTIYTIQEDNHRCIWVGGQEGLCIYNTLTSKFSRVRYTSLAGSLETLKNNVHLLKAVDPGCMLVATQYSGLLVFENGASTGTQIALSQTTSPGQPKNPSQTASYDVTALEQGPDGRVWVFVQNQGLFTYDRTQKRLQPVNNNIRQANCMKTDKQGRLWVATDIGLFLYDPKSNSYGDNFMPAKVKVVTLSPDKQGILWIGSDGAGVWTLPDDATTATPIPKNTINSNAIFVIYQDATQPNGISSNFITNVIRDYQGDVWMSTWFGGVDKIGEAYGYVLYRTTLKGGASGVSRLLQIKDVRDYAIVFVNGKRQGILDRMKKQDSLRITVPPGEVEATLDILVENMGRINYGPNLLKNTKGITQMVTLDQKELKGWKIYGFPFDPAGPAAATTAPATASPSETPAAAPSEMPVLKRATFQLDIPRDTYLDMRAWGKGCVWINGHNLGRYWEIGPQQTIYVPAEWLKQGANEIEVFELLKPGQNELKTVTKTILNILHQ